MFANMETGSWEEALTYTQEMSAKEVAIKAEMKNVWDVLLGC